MKNMLRDIRERKVMTQRQFCKVVGSNSQSHDARIEQGADVPVSKALKIAKNLNLKVEDIWKGDK